MKRGRKEDEAAMREQKIAEEQDTFFSSYKIISTLVGPATSPASHSHVSVCLVTSRWVWVLLGAWIDSSGHSKQK